MYRKFREECSALRQEVASLKSQLHVLDNPKDKHLVELLFDAIERERLSPGTFMHTFLTQQLECLAKVRTSFIVKTFIKLLNSRSAQEDVRGFRWDPLIKHWAMLLRFHGGKTIIDALRGEATQQQGAHGDLVYDVSKVGIFLPAPSTLSGYLPHVDPYKGIQQQTVPAQLERHVRSAI